MNDKILEAIHKDVIKIRDKSENHSIALAVQTSKIESIESRLDNGKKGNIEAQKAIRADIKEQTGALTGKLEKMEMVIPTLVSDEVCKSRKEYLEKSASKHKRLTYGLATLVITGGAGVGAGVGTEAGRSMIGKIIASVLGL